MIDVKILSLGDPERYAIRRLVVSAEQVLLSTVPELELNITEVKEAEEIGRYAQVLVLPTLVINERVVCSGRFPSQARSVGMAEKIWLTKKVNDRRSIATTQTTKRIACGLKAGARMSGHSLTVSST